MSEEKDELYGKAAHAVISSGKVSTSYVQRELQIGYNRAARIIEDLEKNWVISQAHGLGKRVVTEKGKQSLELSEKIVSIGKAHGITNEKVLDAVKEEAGIGHNSKTIGPKDVGGIGGQRLMSFIERIERLNEEKAALMEDIKEVFAECKGVGYDTKTVRKIVSARKKDPEKRREEEELYDLYAQAIGMQGSLPLSE